MSAAILQLEVVSRPRRAAFGVYLPDALKVALAGACLFITNALIVQLVDHVGASPDGTSCRVLPTYEVPELDVLPHFLD